MADQNHHKTVLGADCRITGELSLDNDAVIMGQFKGTLRVRGVLELTDSSRVIGTVVAGALRIAGTVQADVVAEQGIELLAGATLEGQVYTNHLNIVDGAVFRGEVVAGPKALEAAGKLLEQIAQSQIDDDDRDAAGNLSLTDANEGEQADEDADASVTTVPTSIDAILKRRRPKTLVSGGLRTISSNSSGSRPTQARAS